MESFDPHGPVTEPEPYTAAEYAKGIAWMALVFGPGIAIIGWCAWAYLK